ncbi:MAG TPA: DUF1905 domain-containing protein [Patescibacteria group bacterium]|nr:DUF1905 domain-containing protein [Patescibacteria group bacterium]
MKTTNRYDLRAELWIYPGSVAAWHFITVPKKQGEDIRKRFGAKARGWRSLPVAVTIGATRWKTSIFPDSKAGSYLLPVKAAVRKKEKLMEGETIAFTLEILA